ncbi:MAG: cytochrome P450 [bacterium]
MVWTNWERLSNKYDPDRFLPERAEDRKHPFSLIGFGSGPHKCMGKHFAYTEMKVVLTLLLRQYHLELSVPDPKPNPGPTPNRPKSPCRIKYQRK